MPSLPRLTRTDPRWEEEGPSARREHRRQRIRELSAFATSLVAVAGAGAVWAVRLGVAGLGRG
jgi:hypothetical protein